MPIFQPGNSGILRDKELLQRLGSFCFLLVVCLMVPNVKGNMGLKNCIFRSEMMQFRGILRTGEAVQVVALFQNFQQFGFSKKFKYSKKLNFQISLKPQHNVLECRTKVSTYLVFVRKDNQKYRIDHLLQRNACILQGEGKAQGLTSTL